MSNEMTETSKPKAGRASKGRLEETLLGHVLPIVEAAGLDLVELRLGRGHRGTLVSIFVDRFPGEGGVTIDDCAKVSRRLSALFEVDDPVPGAWELEVSSPGTKRLLRHAADMQRFVGVRARVALQETVDRGRQTLVGEILGADDEGVTLRVDGGERRTVSFGEIGRATLDPTTEQWLELGRRAEQEREALARTAQSVPTGSGSEDAEEQE